MNHIKRNSLCAAFAIAHNGSTRTRMGPIFVTGENGNGRKNQKYHSLKTGVQQTQRNCVNALGMLEDHSATPLKGIKDTQK